MNMPTDLASRLSDGLRLPVIVAPMFLISGPDLVVAAGKAGVLGVYTVAKYPSDKNTVPFQVNMLS